MASQGTETLETLLNRATSPMNQQEDWDTILSFCDQINKELEGPQIAVRLLAHKIQSPQERESLYALSTLESCVKSCGKRFHAEIGKFRFLNEIIKVVSPKYLGNYTSEKVKKKCIEFLYSWSVSLSHEPKISEAYQMMKRQGIVKEDPIITSVDTTVPPPEPREVKGTIFEDEEKSKTLARLLRSKHPEDLQAANRLIKNMVKQDAERMEKVSKRVQQIETVSNNVKLLSEMLAHYQPGNSSESDRDIMKELYDNLEKQRPNLFRLASDTDEKDNDGINAILKCNDEVLKVMTDYKRIVAGDTSTQNGSLISMDAAPNTSTTQGALSDIFSLEGDSLLSCSPVPALRPPPPPPSYASTDSGPPSLLESQLMDLGITTTETPASTGANSDFDVLGDIFSAAPPLPPRSTTTDSNSLLDFSFPSPPAPPATAAANSLSSSVQPTSANSSLLLSSSPLAHSSNSFDAVSSSPSQTLVGLGPSSSNPFSSSSLVSTASNFAAFSAAATLTSSSSAFGGPSILTPAPSVNPQSSTASKQQQQQNATQTSAGMKELDALGHSLLQQSLSSDKVRQNSVQRSLPAPKAPKIPMNQMTRAPSGPSGDVSLISASPAPTPPASVVASPAKTAKTAEVLPLTDVFVPLQSIQPGTEPPISPYDKNNLKIVMHFAKDRPRPDVAVMVVSIMSTNTHPVKNFVFQVAVPKVMKVKLQPPSATDLPAFNPILPPAAITQVMLVANPQKENIRAKFKISYTVDSETRTDVGEIDNIPIK